MGEITEYRMKYVCKVQKNGILQNVMREKSV